MMLMEEDIGEILFVCMDAEADGGIECVMEMVIENHLADKREIESAEVGDDERATDPVSEWAQGWENRRRQAHAQEQEQEHIRIEVHAPPKAIAEAS